MKKLTKYEKFTLFVSALALLVSIGSAYYSYKQSIVSEQMYILEAEDIKVRSWLDPNTDVSVEKFPTSYGNLYGLETYWNIRLSNPSKNPVEIIFHQVSSFATDGKESHQYVGTGFINPDKKVLMAAGEVIHLPARKTISFVARILFPVDQNAFDIFNDRKIAHFYQLDEEMRYLGLDILGRPMNKQVQWNENKTEVLSYTYSPVSEIGINVRLITNSGKHYFERMLMVNAFLP